MRRFIVPATTLLLCAPALAQHRNATSVLEREEMRLSRGWVHIEEQLDARAVDTQALQVRAEAELGEGGDPQLAVDGSVQFVFGRVAPKILCRPAFNCDIALHADEQIVNYAAGTGRKGDWHVSIVASPVDPTGTRTRRPHIVVRPKGNGTKTSLTVWTTQRTYHMDLIPSDRPMRFVSFAYPDEDNRKALAAQALSAHQQRQAGAGSGPFSGEPWKWHHHYEFDCESRWRVCRRIRSWMVPESVSDDGNITQITMPEEALSRDRPVFHVITPSGEREEVNYRVHGRVYIIPQVFQQGSLRLAHGKRRRQAMEIRIRRVED